ncbi:MULTISPECIES: glycine oxidase ThiO [Okeania]|uniref:glycine oxidase n=1 Tax=Okeania hirsuta TaxID=1458930 RepID=A0A3N6NPI3_9CYAN|nr:MULTISPECIES: glycine oxidase ThiO [Okeania]NET14018.1 glycine oxidase ThiO [Okeania sp. SIO1H6]NES74945.1 glycine oxidase ThiO [Okeania sp. SIO1H4]NES92629.1 glycine oxidase ThiO [Okeania sp. SIO2B9]NET18264.1 glycine oxidase ThiO [Okeania sp. SIO1H5]NET75215.1 glycine oxidase ThiO [Okeania sp. SIO1F9]
MNQSSNILIIGGGIIGLSIAIELTLRGAKVTVISRDFQQTATNAAAGMLAPQAEAIPPGKMLDLCLKSRALYPEWVKKIESISGIKTGYWPCGILAPVYAEKDRENYALQNLNYQWLNQAEIHQYQPGLGLEVIGGWSYPEDGQVDNRYLYESTIAAAKELKIDILEGIVIEIIRQKGKIQSIKTSIGELQAEHYVLATGAWSQELLPIPVFPRKGQMLSLKIPSDIARENLPLQQVLFGTESYIVPRQDGRIVIGATNENVGFSEGNTAAGIQELLGNAIRLYPSLKNYKILELWWGFRPNTPDEMPILGTSNYDNLTIATGHYRNGILLTPVTALLIADLIWNNKSARLLDAFNCSRFAEVSSKF